jgi:Tol biopolymer transport system component
MSLEGLIVVIFTNRVALALWISCSGCCLLGFQVGFPTRLTNIINSYPSASPDGRHIAFASTRSGEPQIFVMNANGSEVKQLTWDRGGNVTPAWSPDGAMIAFASTEQRDGSAEIYVMNADGSHQRRLTNHPADDSHPHWSPDSQRIIFSSSRTTSPGGPEWDDIFSMTADGTELRKLTDCRAICTFPSYSPDMRHIAYRKVLRGPGFNWDLSASQRNSEVFVAYADGTQEVNISNSAGFDGWPQWSPNGLWIAFSSNRVGPANVGQIFVVHPDGTGLRQISSAGSFVQPSWSKDGTRIYAYQNVETADYEYGDIVVFEFLT